MHLRPRPTLLPTALLFLLLSASHATAQTRDPSGSGSATTATVEEGAIARSTSTSLPRVWGRWMAEAKARFVFRSTELFTRRVNIHASGVRKPTR